MKNKERPGRPGRPSCLYHQYCLHKKTRHEGGCKSNQMKRTLFIIPLSLFHSILRCHSTAQYTFR